MQDPVSVKDVQNLTGRVAALNRFIPRAAERSLPFFQVLRSSKNFQWSKTQKQAFQELKNYLSNMTQLLSYGPPWAHYLGGYQDRLLGGPLGLLGLCNTTPDGVGRKDYGGEVLG
jgi:hypothetical protein